MTWASWIDFLLGIWLIIAPFALGYRGLSGRATGVDVIFGILIAAFSLWTALKISAPRFTYWLLMLFGLWILISPFALQYREIARTTPNNVLVGVIVLVLAAVRAGMRRPVKHQTV